MMLLALLAAAAPAPADIQCVATLALATREQSQGRGTQWPPLAEDGGRFAQTVGESAMKSGGQTRDQVRDAILAAVAARGDAAPGDAEVKSCIARMREVAPPPVAPGLPQCAAMIALAREEAPPADAARLAPAAEALDRKARAALAGEGRSASEADKAMADARAAIAAELKMREADGVSAGLDYAPCLAMVSRP